MTSSTPPKVVRIGYGSATGETWAEDERGQRYSVGPARDVRYPQAETQGWKLDVTVKVSR